MINKMVWRGIVTKSMVLSCLMVGLLNARHDRKRGDGYIRERIKQEIVDQLHHTNGKAVRDDHHYANRAYHDTKGDIYLLPHWPAYSLFFNHGDLINVTMSFDTASQAYKGHGGTQDLSGLVFGEDKITIKDILLASKLAKNGQLVALDPLNTIALTQKNHYLSFLADQEVLFDASLQQYGISLDYERSYRNGSVVVGFRIPLKMRHQRLRLTNDLTPENIKKIENVSNGFQVDGTNLVSQSSSPVPRRDLVNQIGLQFNGLYDNFEDFVSQILARKGIALNHKDTILGLSDAMGYVTLDIPTRYADRLMTGVSLLLPTARERDVNKLWDADLGNGGFIELSWYTSLVWQRSRWFNPHLHVRGTYNFAANVARRVPKQNIYTANGTSATFNGIGLGNGNLPVRSLILFGETLNFLNGSKLSDNSTPSVPFTEVDSTVRNFADQAINVKINRGASIFCRVGNTFDAIFSNKAFFDVYYDFYAKGKDYVVRHRSDDVFQSQILGHNTYEIAHLIGANYSYQFDAQYRARAGISYAVAGRNSPKRLGAEISLNAEF